jgi:hypothetical protein
MFFPIPSLLLQTRKSGQHGPSRPSLDIVKWRTGEVGRTWESGSSGGRLDLMTSSELECGGGGGSLGRCCRHDRACYVVRWLMGIEDGGTVQIGLPTSEFGVRGGNSRLGFLTVLGGRLGAL